MDQVWDCPGDRRVDLIDILIDNVKPLFDEPVHILGGGNQIDSLDSQNARLLLFLESLENPLDDLVVGRVEHIKVFFRIMENGNAKIHNGMPAVQGQPTHPGGLQGEMLEALKEGGIPAHGHMEYVEESRVLCDGCLQLIQLTSKPPGTQELFVGMGQA